MITQMHVKLKTDTDTPLGSVLASGESGVWKVNINDVQNLRHIYIWDENSHVKMKARVTGVCETKGGKIIQFDSRTANLIKVNWSNRPKFNRPMAFSRRPRSNKRQPQQRRQWNLRSRKRGNLRGFCLYRRPKWNHNRVTECGCRWIREHHNRQLWKRFFFPSIVFRDCPREGDRYQDRLSEWGDPIRFR